MSHQDAPRVVFGREKLIKFGRVQHTCYWCKRAILVGQPKVKTVMMDDESRKVETTYSHPGCEYNA